MDRFLALKRGAFASSPLSSSMISNIGYETAIDESLCSSNASMYYSIDEKTLENPTQSCPNKASDDQTMHSIIEYDSPKVLTPIAENRSELFSPKSRHRNLACASTPLQLADMKTPDSPIMHKSSRTTGTVRRNLLSVSNVVMEVDETATQTSPQDETIKPPIVLVTSPKGIVSIPSVPDVVSCIAEEEPKAVEKENRQPKIEIELVDKMEKTAVRATLSNAFRRSKRLSVAGNPPPPPSTTSSLGVADANGPLQSIAEVVPGTGPRINRRSMAPTKQRLLAIPEIVVTASEKQQVASATVRPRRLTIAPSKPIELAAPIQRHALRKTIVKPKTPQRRTASRRSSLAKQRTPAGKLLRAKTPQKSKPEARLSINKPKTPVRIMTRRQSVTQSQRSPRSISSSSSTSTEPKPSHSLGQTSFDCNSCSKQFLQFSTLRAHQRSHATNGTSPKKDTNKCRHCDKIFVLPIALRSHLELNCTKISAVERRKLMAAPSLPDIRVIRPARRPAVLDSAHSGVYRTPNKKLKCTQCQKMFSDMAQFMEHRITHSVNI